MKRYNTPLDHGNNSFTEDDEGDWVPHYEVTALHAQVAGLVRALPHEKECKSRGDWVAVDAYRMQWKFMPCDCNISKALALLERP